MVQTTQVSVDNCTDNGSVQTDHIWTVEMIDNVPKMAMDSKYAMTLG